MTIDSEVATPELSHRYLWGPGTDQLLVDEVFNTSTGVVNDTLWAANDHLGSVNDLVALNETVVEHREYDSFGAIDQVFDQAGVELADVSDMQSDYAFAGRTWDDDAELYYNRARWYQPDAGRFIGEDPAVDGSNWYTYAGNDPVNYRDPLGLSPAGNPLNSIYSSLGGGFNENYGTGTLNVGSGNPFSNSVYNSLAAPGYSAPSFVSPSFTPSSQSWGIGTNDYSSVSNLINSPVTLASIPYVPLPGSLNNNSSSLLSNIGSFIGNVASTAQTFGSNYISYLGTEIETAGQTIVDTGDSVGTTIGHYGSGLYYEPVNTTTEIATNVYDAGVGLKNFATNTYNNPGQALSNFASGTVSYFDQLTSDPEASGKLLGDFAVAWATGGTTAAGKQAISTSFNALRKLGRIVDAVEDVAPGNGTKVTRNWGGQSGPDGQAWTRDPVSEQSRESLGLGRSNTGQYVSHGEIIDNTGVTTRKARQWDGFKGGGDEVRVPNPKRQIRVDAVTMPDRPLPDRRR